MRQATASKCVLVMGVLCGLAYTCRATVLDFNLPLFVDEDSYGVGKAYVEDGYRFRTLSNPGHFPSIIRFDPSYLPGALPNNGTPYFGATYFSTPHMDRVDGGLFSISQIDLSSYSVYAQVSSISIRGNRADGSFVTETFGLPGWDGVFHTYQFGTQWSNLESVEVLTVASAWDNIVVNTIPEPETEVLMVFGVLALFVPLTLKRISPPQGI